MEQQTEQEQRKLASELKQWQEHPMTRKVLADLKERRRVGQENWAQGMYPTPEQNAQMVGGQQALAAMIDYMEGEEE